MNYAYIWSYSIKIENKVQSIWETHACPNSSEFLQFFCRTHFSLVRIIESLQQLNSSAFSTATGTN